LKPWPLGGERPRRERRGQVGRAFKEKGGYVDFHSAQQAMTSLRPISYDPKPENQAIYNQLYALYRQLHDAFGGINKCADLSGVMKELIQIKEKQTHGLNS
jgi:ribulose kinase